MWAAVPGHAVLPCSHGPLCAAANPPAPPSEAKETKCPPKNRSLKVAEEGGEDG